VLEEVGVLKSLEQLSFGPVVLVHAQKIGIQSEKPTETKAGKVFSEIRLPCAFRSTSVFGETADIASQAHHVRSGPILLKKSKIERLRKSREARLLGLSAAALLRRYRHYIPHRYDA
jgi:hypothetical protein